MTKQTQEALKMAIEHIEHDGATTERKMVLQACKEALEQPAQEPVAWLLEYRDGEFDYWHKNCDEDKLALEMWFDAIRYDTTEHKIYPLYTHPAPSWQGLSDDEIDDVKTKAIMGANGMSVEQLLGLIVSLTEQALMEKNT